MDVKVGYLLPSIRLLGILYADLHILCFNASYIF